MSPPRVIAGWGAFMGLICLVGVVFFDLNGPETPAFLGGVAVVMLVLALLLRLLRLGVSAPDGTRPSPDLSPATAWLGVSLVLLAAGAELGLWLVYIAGGMSALGVAGLVRELRAERRAAESAEEA
jgi:hypothetical protein